MTEARHYLGEDQTILMSGQNGLPIPAALTMAPGYYYYNQNIYDCTAEGLYKFFNPMTDTTHRIVFQSDIYALASALSWLCVHGRADESLTPAQAYTRANTSKLRVQCSKTTQFVNYVMNSLSIPSRTVRLLTAETPNNYADGHVISEIYFGGSWIAVDANVGFMFRKDGAFLNARDAVYAVQDETVELVHLDAGGFSIEPFVPSSFDATAYAEIFFRTKELRADWAKRQYQIVGIDYSDGNTYWHTPPGTEDRASWFESLSPAWIAESLSSFNSRFYA